MDIISKLPLFIIETILCLLPIQEAARTSILSKEWRYHWINLPKLAFVENTFQVSTDHVEMSVLSKKIKKCKLMKNAINQVLLKHEGPLHEFVFIMDFYESCDKIDNIILLLSKKNTLKKLRFKVTWGGCMVPLLLSSLRQLTDLSLSGCVFILQAPIDGFGSLTNLSLQNVHMSKKTLLHLLSSFPSLTNLITGTDVHRSDDSTIIDLFECLHAIENLTILMRVIECFVEDGVPKVLKTALINLKYLFIQDISFTHIFGLHILVPLIKSSPNLKKLKLKILVNFKMEKSERRGSFTLEEYSDIRLEHLNELEITNVKMKNELDFVKLILAKAPMLKKVRVFLYNGVTKEEELEISRILLCSPHTSSVVEIIVDNDKCSACPWL